MSITMLVFQFVLPLSVLAWFTFFPAQTRAGLMLQIISISVFLSALSLTAMWAIPLWWLPRVYAVMFALMIIALFIRNKQLDNHKPSGNKRGAISLALSTILFCIGAYFLVVSLFARTPPADVPIVDLAKPLGPGHYIAVQAGSERLLNEHLRTLDTSVPRYSAWRGQSYAIDFVGIGSWGLRAIGLRPSNPEGYAIFGAKVVSPCAGIVVTAIDGRPDMRVPDVDLEQRLGNHVIINCADAHIVLAHLKQGSVRVVTSQKLESGQLIAEVGNSGASGEPHLHIHAQTPGQVNDSPISGKPLAITIDHHFLVRGDQIEGDER